MTTDADERRDRLARDRFDRAMAFLRASADAPRLAREKEEAAHRRTLETRRQQILWSTFAVCLAMLVSATFVWFLVGTRYRNEMKQANETVVAANAKVQRARAQVAQAIAERTSVLKQSQKIRREAEKANKRALQHAASAEKARADAWVALGHAEKRERDASRKRSIANADAKLYLGVVDFQNGSWSEAITNLTTAISDLNGVSGHEKDLAIAHFFRGRSYASMAESSPGQLANERALVDYDAAVRIYEQHFPRDPTLGILYNGRGVAHRALNQFSAAVHDYTKAIMLDRHSDPAMPLYNRALAFHKMGRADAAIQDFTAAIGLFHRGNRPSDEADAYASRGELYRTGGKPDQALSDFSTAIRLNFALARAYMGRARVYVSRADSEPNDHAAAARGYGLAVADCDRVLEMQPHNVAARRMRERAARLNQALGDSKDVPETPAPSAAPQPSR